LSLCLCKVRVSSLTKNQIYKYKNHVVDLVKTLKIGILEKRNPKFDNTHGLQSARRIITSYRFVTMTTYFGNVVHVETPHNTAEALIFVSTVHATVETTSSSNDSLARKQYSSLMLMEDGHFSTHHPKKAARLNKTHMSRLTTVLLYRLGLFQKESRS
jgi:hypothetical protein